MDGYRGRFRGSSIYDSPSICQLPVSSSRLSPLLPSRSERAAEHGPTSFAPRTRRPLNSGHPEEEERCHYPANMFGRSFDEIFADLAIMVNREAPRSMTPSLDSDSDSTLPSTPSVASPISFTYNLSPNMSPPASPGQPWSKGRKRTISEVEEDSLVSATQGLRIWPTSRRLSLDIGGDMEEPPSIQVDAPSPQFEENRNVSPGPSLPLPQILEPPRTMQLLLEAAELQRSDMEKEEHEVSPSVHLITPNFPSASLGQHHGKQPKKPNGAFACTQCAKTFTRRFDLQRHITNVHEAQSTAAARALTCPVCYETLSRRDAFRRHYLKVPSSCVRQAKLRGKDPEAPLKQPESLYKLCREGRPPLPQIPLPQMPLSIMGHFT